MRINLNHSGFEAWRSGLRARAWAGTRRSSCSRLFAGAALAFSLLAVPFSGGSAQANDDVPDMKDRALACTGCHGQSGVATPGGFFPRIAGKPAGYLFNQLRHFQSGRRHFKAMGVLVHDLPETYLAAFAHYFAEQDLPYAPPVPHPQSVGDAKRALELITDGDASKQVPSCRSCHGDQLTGVAPAVPGLLGLPRDYLNAQLGAWRSGTRHGDEPDCMSRIVDGLPDDDLAKITTFLANLPVPDRGKPAKAFPQKDPPIDCGSLHPRPAFAPEPATADAGAYLARIGNCSGCHTVRDGQPYAGGVGIDTPFGRVYGSNLTPDREFGIGAWSADDFWRAMTEGIRPDGRLLSPVFPYQFFANLTRADSDALYTYLRSLPAVAQPSRNHDLRFPYGLQIALRAWRWLYFDPAPRANDPASNDQAARAVPDRTAIVAAQGESSTDSDDHALLARGRYLVDAVAHCQVCHGERNRLGGFARIDKSGGSRLPGESGYAPDLSRGNEAGVGHWPIEEIEQFLASGESPRGGAQGLMLQVVQYSTQFLTPFDRRAMARWLQTLSPEVAPLGEADRPYPARMTSIGQERYESLCADCHGRDGQGQPGRYPALAGRRSVLLDDPVNAVKMVLYGGFGAATPARPWPFGMPGFAHRLDDRELARVLDYARSAWGNSASAVRSDRIQEMR